MFILMISRGVPTPQDPQWGCFEKDQAEALAALGHKVVVASVDSRFLWRWRHIGITHLTINGVDYYDSFFIPGAITNIMGSAVNTKIKQLQLNNIYNEIIKTDGRPDVIYGQFFFNSYIAISLSKRTNIPLVTIEHAARFNNEYIDKKSLYQSKAVYANTKANIAVSQSLKDSLAKHFGIDCHVVHNVYNKEFSYTASINRNQDKVQYVTCGSLVFRKGFDFLIRVISSLDLPKDKWDLTIIGDGEERLNLQKQIEECGLNEHIHLIGSKDKREIVQILNKSSVFILPSRNETFSVVCIEAMACGLPVIATICGGPEEFVTEKDGLLVPVNDVDAMGKAIKYMFEHHQDYNRQVIADNCKARFSSEVIAKKLSGIFEEVISKQ